MSQPYNMAIKAEAIQLVHQIIDYHWEEYETIYNYLRNTSTL